MGEQIGALLAANAISSADADTLATGAGFLRSVDHLLRLVTGRAPGGLPENGADVETVETLAVNWNLITAGQTLLAMLHETQQQLRYVYRRLVGSE